MSALSLLVTVICDYQSIRFWAFCAFEACLGLYFPSIGYLKSRLIDDASRGKVYGIMRVPLNAFVFISLISMQGGKTMNFRVVNE